MTIARKLLFEATAESAWIFSACSSLWFRGSDCDQGISAIGVDHGRPSPPWTRFSRRSPL